MATERKPRPIRMDDEEWKIFREDLGTVWLRDQIAKAAKRNARVPTKHKTEE